MSLARILFVHSRYVERGGEDAVVDAEMRLLHSRGHDVALYFRDNADAASIPRLRLGMEAIWSSESAKGLRAHLRRFRPDVMHVHNVHPLISPAVFWVARAERVPLVCTFHNYRLSCLNGLLSREGNICEDCVGRTPWRGVVRRCYRDNYGASLALATSITVHKAISTYSGTGAKFIALNDFAAGKLVQSGLPAGAVVVKSNFTERFVGSTDGKREGFLFVGRLVKEKGVETLIAAAKRAAAKVKVIGGGPLADAVRSSPVEYLGTLDRTSVLNEMAKVQAVVIPSLWYEGSPVVAAEAFATGTPIIVSDLGALPEIAGFGSRGKVFRAGDEIQLAELLSKTSRVEFESLGRQAYKHYNEELTPDANYLKLRTIYSSVKDAVIS